MAVKTTSKEKRTKQAERTRKNQNKRYTALLEARPSDPHRKTWEANIK